MSRYAGPSVPLVYCPRTTLSVLTGSTHRSTLTSRPNVVRGERARLLHGDEAEELEQVVLDDVADDAVLVEVPAPALRAEGLLEDDLDVGDVVAVPSGARKRFAKRIATGFCVSSLPR